MATMAHAEHLGYNHDNLRHVVITATCFALSISTISVALRLLCRKITGTKVFLDDYLIIVALAFLYGVSVAGVVLLYNGLGTHIYFVPAADLVLYLKVLATGSFMYPLCIAFTKLSILALYKRIFSIRPMILAANTVGSLVILWCFGVCLIGTVTCIPLQKLWDPSIPGGCINLAKFYYGLQIPNIATDAIILVLPMKHVWELQVPRSQKVMLTGIFLLGALTLAFDIVRLVTLIELSKAGSDITYNQVPASVWTCIEPCVGITAACLSNMRPLFLMLTRIPLKIPSLSSQTSTTATGEVNRSKIVFTRTVRVASSHGEHGDDHSSAPSRLHRFPYIGRAPSVSISIGGAVDAGSRT